VPGPEISGAERRSLDAPRTVNWGERAAPWIVVAASLLGLMHGVNDAAHRPLWFDELSTVLVASQHSLAEYFRVQPPDAQPPLEALLVHFALRLPLPVEIGIRIPSMIAYLVAGWAIYFFLGRRGTLQGAALGATSFLLGTPVLFAAEARPYALMMASCACVLLFWQRMVWGRHRMMWAVALAIAIALFCLSQVFGFLFAVIPIGMAEFVRWQSSKRIDRRIVFATLAGLSPIPFVAWLSRRTMLLFFIRFHGARSAAASPDLASLVGTVVLLRSEALQLGLAAAFLVIFLGTKEPEVDASDRTFQRAEWVATSGLIVAAFVNWLMAVIYTHYYFPRYGCACFVAIAILCGMALSLRGGAMRRVSIWATQSAILVTFAGTMILHSRTSSVSAAANSHAAPLHAVPVDQLPIVVASGLEYQEVQRYAEPRLRPRLIYLTDSAEALRTKDFVPELVIEAYTDLGALNLPVEPYDGFVKSHSSFYLLTCGDRTEWVQKALLRDGFQQVPGPTPSISRFER
jgi:hypothetical protein